MSKRRIICTIVGLICCILPPAVATVQFFPLWKQDQKSAVSGMAVILLVLCCVPLWKYIKAALKSPSAWKLWTIVLIFSFVTKSISDEMFVISAIGLPSSLLGAFIFHLGKKGKHERDV